MRRIVTISLMGLLCLSALADSLTHTFTMDCSLVSTSTTSIDNTNYTVVSHPQLEHNCSAGEPDLPVAYLTFHIPAMAKNLQATCTSRISGGLHPTIYQVYPVQEDYPMNMEPVFTEPDSAAYSTSYPTSLVGIVNDGYFNGDKRLVTLKVCPFIYNTTLIQSFSSMTINLSWDMASSVDELPLRPISRQTASNGAPRSRSSEPDTDLFPGMDILQPLSFEDPVVVPLHPLNPDVKGYEYTIVTSEELAPAFERLVALRRQKGMDCGIVTMENILNEYAFVSGDIRSGINDDAGKLRAFITYAFQHCNTQYVLLGGSSNHVPIRYGTYLKEKKIKNITPPIDRDPIIHEYNCYLIPTDLYFAEINNNWNNRNDEYIGSQFDISDYIYDVYVGRLLCNTREEVNNYIDKVEIYENNPGKGDREYLNNSVSFFSVDFLENDSILAKLSNIVDNIYPIYQPQDSTPEIRNHPTGREAVEIINLRKPGILTFNCHGNPAGIQTAYERNHAPAYGINSLDSICINQEEESLNGFDNITNSDWPFFVYATSCSTMPYDTIPHYENISYSVGQSLTLGKGYGAIAFSGNTRDSWEPHCNDLINRFFLALDRQGLPIGALEGYSKLKIPDQMHHWNNLAHNLLGDPAIKIWTSVPENPLQSIMFNNSVQVFGTTLADSTTVAIAPLNGNRPTIRKFSGTLGSVTNIPVNSAITVYSDKNLPNYLPVSVQYGVFANKNYVYTSDLKLAHSLYPQIYHGTSVFDSGADFTFRVLGNAQLFPGVVIRNNASLSIVADGNVNITSTTIDSGGSLNINSRNCEIRNIEIPVGAEFFVETNL